MAVGPTNGGSLVVPTDIRDSPNDMDWALYRSADSSREDQAFAAVSPALFSTSEPAWPSASSEMGRSGGTAATSNSAGPVQARHGSVQALSAVHTSSLGTSTAASPVSDVSARSDGGGADPSGGPTPTPDGPNPPPDGPNPPPDGPNPPPDGPNPPPDGPNPPLAGPKPPLDAPNPPPDGPPVYESDGLLAELQADGLTDKPGQYAPMHDVRDAARRANETGLVNGTRGGTVDLAVYPFGDKHLVHEGYEFKPDTQAAHVLPDSAMRNVIPTKGALAIDLSPQVHADYDRHWKAKTQPLGTSGEAELGVKDLRGYISPQHAVPRDPQVAAALEEEERERIGIDMTKREQGVLEWIQQLELNRAGLNDSDMVRMPWSRKK